jgi:oligopeptide transport system permease protein
MKVPYIVKYSIQRILLLLVTTFIILTLTFFLVKLLPDGAMPTSETGQYAFCREQVSLGYYIESSNDLSGFGDAIFRYTNSDGLHIFYRKPIIQQYFAWLTGIFTKWNWGLSTTISAGNSAMTIILNRLKPTVIVNIFAMLISVPLGFLFGIIAALKKNKWQDNLISTVVMVLISVPSFVTISLLLSLLAFQTNWLPSAWPNEGASIGQYASALVIPVLSLSFGTIAGFTRYTRAELTEVISSEFLLLARTKGLTRKQSIVRHALRNSMVPIVPMIIGEFIGILSGSMILEQLYGIPGIGSLFINCITQKDYNVLLVDMAVYTVIGLVANLFVDLSYGIIDPRIRMGAKA